MRDWGTGKDHPRLWRFSGTVGHRFWCRICSMRMLFIHFVSIATSCGWPQSWLVFFYERMNYCTPSGCVTGQNFASVQVPRCQCSNSSTRLVYGNICRKPFFKIDTIKSSGFKRNLSLEQILGFKRWSIHRKFLPTSRWMDNTLQKGILMGFASSLFCLGEMPIMYHNVPCLKSWIPINVIVNYHHNRIK